MATTRKATTAAEKTAVVQKATARKAAAKKAATTPARPARKAAAKKTTAPARAVKAQEPAEAVAGRARAQGRRFAPAAELSGETPAPAAADPAEAQADAGGGQPAEMSWDGRTMPVRMPRPEQLAVMRRLAHRFTDTERLSGMTVDDLADLSDRAIKVVAAVLVEDRDRQWLEDAFLDGSMTLETALPFIKEAMAAVTGKPAQPAAAGGRARRTR